MLELPQRRRDWFQWHEVKHLIRYFASPDILHLASPSISFQHYLEHSVLYALNPDQTTDPHKQTPQHQPQPSPPHPSPPPAQAHTARPSPPHAGPAPASPPPGIRHHLRHARPAQVIQHRGHRPWAQRQRGPRIEEQHVQRGLHDAQDGDAEPGRDGERGLGVALLKGTLVRATVRTTRATGRSVRRRRADGRAWGAGSRCGPWRVASRGGCTRG